MIKALILIISVFLLVLIESFFLRVFSFSILVIVVISIYKRVEDSWVFLLIALMGIALDTVLHMPLGLHMVILGVLLLFLKILWVVIPRGSNLGYFALLMFFASYYLLLPIGKSLIQDSVFPEILPNLAVWTLVKGIVSIGVCIVVDRFFTSLRDSNEGSSIRLR